jgi:D-glycero-alpha-D-manno-heptose-7-phosphate kinase
MARRARAQVTDTGTPRRVRARAPVRVLDAGGWTDTWFAMTGSVCSLAMDDGAEVTVERTSTTAHATQHHIELSVPAFDDRYEFAVDEPPGRHPLLEATLRRCAPRHESLRVTVASSVPPGAGLGTSASVVVALIAALHAATATVRDAASLVKTAHDIETNDLGVQSGVQDQVAAAYGGANLITIDPYPDVDVRALAIAPATWDTLADRVLTVYLDAPHRSGELHEMVIKSLIETPKPAVFASLRAAAQRAAVALVAGDIDAYGDAMIDNTEAQVALHPTLISPLARNVIALAKRAGAIGWKANGAGGHGGTLTIIAPENSKVVRAELAAQPGLTVLPLRPARYGARVIDQELIA